MTVTNQTNKVRYDGDGATVAFDFSFKVFAKTDIKVYLIDTTVDLEADPTPLTQNTDYSVTLNTASEGGTITFLLETPSLTDEVLIVRELAYTQPSAIPTESNLPEIQIENALDRAIMLLQQIAEEVGRSIKISISSDAVPMLPGPSAGKVLYWDGSDGDIANSTKTITAIEAAVDAVSALSSGSGALVSANDAFVGFLNGKLVAGNAITLTENNDGANETLTVAVTDGQIDTAELADNAVTLAKLASGTAGNLITYDASGDPAAVATGTAGQFLTSNGAGAAPTFQTIITPWVSYTPTIQGFGTPTGVSFFWRRVNDTLEVMGKFTSGTSTAVEARIGFPTGLTSDATKMPSLVTAGTAIRETATTNSYSLLAQSSVTYFTIGLLSGSGGLVPTTGNAVETSGNDVAIQGAVPATGW